MSCYVLFSFLISFLLSYLRWGPMWQSVLGLTKFWLVWFSDLSSAPCWHAQKLKRSFCPRSCSFRFVWVLIWSSARNVSRPRTHDLTTVWLISFWFDLGHTLCHDLTTIVLSWFRERSADDLTTGWLVSCLGLGPCDMQRRHTNLFSASPKFDWFVSFTWVRFGPRHRPVLHMMYRSPSAVFNNARISSCRESGADSSALYFLIFCTDNIIIHRRNRRGYMSDYIFIQVHDPNIYYLNMFLYIVYMIVYSIIWII